jgi:hypothetical protein
MKGLCMQMRYGLVSIILADWESWIGWKRELLEVHMTGTSHEY